MEGALSILLGVAVLLLLVSFVKAKKTDKIKKTEMEQHSISIMKEIQQLQQQIRDLELDNEITAQEAGVRSTLLKQRALLRQAIELQRRGYSFESIAEKTKMTESEVQLMLSPYIVLQGERRRVANDR